MDDAADGVYSRAPELEDLLKLCAALNRKAVRYLLIGGFAVILHGFVRGTKDIDLLVQGIEIPVAGKELLIRMKDTVRPSDAADVAFLRLRIEEGRRHGKQ